MANIKFEKKDHIGLITFKRTTIFTSLYLRVQAGPLWQAPTLLKWRLKH